MSNIRITFLGTSASVPTSTRNLSSVAIQRNGELFIFDCGEGTQRQMIKAKIGFNRKTTIFISHMHGDHILGLPGLIQTMSLFNRQKTLQIFGPEGMIDFLESSIKTVNFTLKFPIEANEVYKEGILLRAKEYEIHSVMGQHSIPSIVYALVESQRPGRFHPEKAKAFGVPMGPLWRTLQEGNEVSLPDGKTVNPKDVLDAHRPGRKIVVVGDTKPSQRIANFASNADLLIHEATFSNMLSERAEEDMHSTPVGAAKIAKEANVKLLVLTHISARHVNPDILLKEAQSIFHNVIIAEDLLQLDVPLEKNEHSH